MIRITEKNFVKRLNDLNQEMKNIFNEYYLFPNGIISSEKQFRKLHKGDVIISTTYNFIDEYKDHIIRLNAPNIYQTIKEHKKDIDGIINIDGTIFFTNEDESFISLPIGTVFGTKITKSVKTWPYGEYLSNLIGDCGWINELGHFEFIIPEHLILDEDHVKSLVNNGITTIRSNGFSTRITKELVPSLKKTDTVMYYCTPKDEHTFYVNIIIRKKTSDIFVFYRYTALCL